MHYFSILIVDYENDYSETLVNRLTIRGIDAEGVTSGEDALKLIAEKPFDVVIMDINMPGGMDGIETLKEIKKEIPATEADVRQLPFDDNSFDWAIAVATYHHLGGGEHLGALRELKRVLKPGAEAFITVWNKWQPRFWFKPKEVEVPWRQKDQTLYRRYYLFSYGELQKLAREGGFDVESFPESAYRLPLKVFSRNICLLLKG